MENPDPMDFRIHDPWKKYRGEAQGQIQRIGLIFGVPWIEVKKTNGCLRFMDFKIHGTAKSMIHTVGKTNEP